jgi:hypothetical protein
VIADIARFAVWRQFLPVDEPSDSENIVEELYIRVRDLNRDDMLRQKLMTDKPEWLQAESNPERYLRGRVIVNVYEKFRIEILDRSAAFCLSVSD